MKIYIAADHGGFRLKQIINDFLGELGHKVVDLGTNSSESVDYPDIAVRLCKRLPKRGGKGILICGTGVGMSMTANKFSYIRAAVCTNCYTARMSREHNNSNVLCLGARVVGDELAKDIIDTWLRTAFSSESRHNRRVKKIFINDKDLN